MEEITIIVEDLTEEVILGNPPTAVGEINTINTELEAGMTGEALVLNVLSVTEANHTAGTKILTTLYLITDA